MEPSHIPSPPPLNTYSPTLAQLITSLHQLETHQFPIAHVMTLLQNTSLSPDDIKPYRFEDTLHYTRNLIYHASLFELILMYWSAGHASPIHGHEGEKCWMLVLEGTLTFSNYREDTTANGVRLTHLNTVVSTPNFVDGPAEIHCVENNTQKPALSLHLYAQPYFQCDIYDPQHKRKHKISLMYDSVYGTRQT